MTAELITIIAVIVGTVLVIAAAVMWWMNRTPHFDHDESGMLPLFGSMSDSLGSPAPESGVMAGGTVRQQPRNPAAPMTAPMTAPVTVPMTVPMTAVMEPPPTSLSVAAPPSSFPNEAAHAGSGKRQDGAKAGPTIRTFTTAKPVARVAADPADSPVASANPMPMSARKGAPVVGHGVPGTMVEGHLLRFSVPQEGTLQFLPGRLEIAAGQDSGREIRFVHVPGPQGTEVTFGRSEGELYKHIQLRDQTVSRSHARMRLAEGHWYVLNLSQTNPIVHNGRVLANGDEHLLTDGDRIEMGEVLFTFRSR